MWEVDESYEYDCASVLNGHTQDIKMVKWNPALKDNMDKSMIFSSSYDNSIKAWGYEETLEDWTCRYTISGHDSTVWAIDFRSDGCFMVSVSDDKSLMIWRVGLKDFTNCGRIETPHT